MRRLAWLLASGLTCGLGACGTNLLVTHHEVTLRADDGAETPVLVSLREPDGLIQANVHEAPALGFCIGMLCEPIDLLYSTGIAIYALGSDEVSVAAGPAGWLAALTPFATLVPAIHLQPATTRNATAAQLQQLLDDDPERRAAAAREFFGDEAITHLQRR